MERIALSIISFAGPTNSAIYSSSTQIDKVIKAVITTTTSITTSLFYFISVARHLGQSTSFSKLKVLVVHYEIGIARVGSDSSQEKTKISQENKIR